MLKQSIAGIDVSAEKLDVAAEFDQARRTTETFENHASGHKKLCQWVTSALSASSDDERLTDGCRSTGRRAFVPR